MRSTHCLEGVHDSGGLCVAAHPYAPYATGTFEYPLQGIDAVEVWNGLWQSDRSWNADNEAAFSDWGHTLADDVTTGSWRPAMGSSDTHLAGQLGTPQTVVMADDLTASSICPSTPSLAERPPGSVSTCRRPASQWCYKLRSAACQPVSSRCTTTKACCVVPRCPQTGRLRSSGVPLLRSPRLFGSKYVTPMVRWPRSRIRSSSADPRRSEGCRRVSPHQDRPTCGIRSGSQSRSVRTAGRSSCGASRRRVISRRDVVGWSPWIGRRTR